MTASEKEIQSDLDRVGLFTEMSYLSSGDPYRDPPQTPFCEAHHRGVQFSVPRSKKGHDTREAYLDPNFITARVMEGESYCDTVKIMRQQRNAEARKSIGAPFKPSGTTNGSYLGTFGGVVQAMSPLVLPPPRSHRVGRNFTTSPGKKGSGYGYANVGLSGQIEYMSDAYDSFQTKQRSEREHNKLKTLGPAFIANFQKGDYFDNSVCTDKRDLSTFSTPKSQSAAQKVRKLPLLPFKPSSGVKRGISGCFSPYPSSDMVPNPRESRQQEKRPKTAAMVFRPNGGTKSRPTPSVVLTNVTQRPCSVFQSRW